MLRVGIQGWGIPDVLFSDRLNLLAASRAFWAPAPDWGSLHQVCGDFVMPEANEPWALSGVLRAGAAAGAHVARLDGAHGPRPRAPSLGRRRPRGKRSRDHPDEGPRRARRGARRGALLPPPGPALSPGSALLRVRAPWRRGDDPLGPPRGDALGRRPFIVEQRLWARQLRAVGAAAAPVSFWNATPERLAERIRGTVASETLRGSASRLAAAMARAEDGTRTAARLIELEATRQFSDRPLR